jgi:hypothetical protein
VSESTTRLPESATLAPRVEYERRADGVPAEQAAAIAVEIAEQVQGDSTDAVSGK